MRTDAIFSKKSDHWSTPTACKESLYAEFGLDFDPCPLQSETDGLAVWWKGKRVFVNPPYSNIPAFLAKWREADIAVYLLPSRTGTKWFHETVLPFAKEIRFLRGRLKFGGGTGLVGKTVPHRTTSSNYGKVQGFDSVLKELRVPSSWQKFNTEVGLHPTQKPVALMEYLIRTYTNEGDTVLDNCMGSGTTGVACLRTGRNFVGIEQDEKHFQTAKQRIEQEALCLSKK